MVKTLVLDPWPTATPLNQYWANTETVLSTGRPEDCFCNHQHKLYPVGYTVLTGKPEIVFTVNINIFMQLDFCT